MLAHHLQDHHIILASGSPRRQQFLKDLHIPFEIRLKPVDEVYPDTLAAHEISDYLAKLKAVPFQNELKPKDILITSDTIVWHQEKALGKPKDAQEAFEMIQSMSGQSHEVFTSICLTSDQQQKVVHEQTTVHFKEFTKEEIDFYIEHYQPYDKAGAYGIQEWIGNIGVTKIQGSYVNVMGMPVHLLYKTLIEFTS